MQNGLRPRRSLPFQVLAAVLMVAAATAFTAALRLFAPQFAFGIYYAAVVIAAFYAGVRAGVLTALLAGLVANFLFVEAGPGFLAAPGDVLQLVTFWAICGVICTLIYKSRRNEDRLRERERFIQNLAATAPYTLYLYDVPADRIDYVTADAPSLDGAVGGSATSSRAAADPARMHPHDRIRYIQHLSDLMAAPDGTVLTFQYRQNVPGPHDTNGTDAAEGTDAGSQWCWYERQERVYDRLDGGAVQHVLGVVQDIDARKRAEDRVRYQAQLLDSVDQAIIAVGLDLHVIFWNRFAENLYGWTAEEACGQVISDLIAVPSTRTRADEIVAALRAGRSWSGEFLVRHKDGTTFYVDLIDAPIYDEEGSVIGILGTSVDLAQRKRAESYLQFLSDASLALASSLDYKTTIQRVADLAVPRIADWCAVDLLRPGSSVELVAVAHVNPAKVRWAHELRRQSPPNLDEEQGLGRVIKTGESEFYPSIPQELVDAQDFDDEEMAIFREIGMRSVIIVPMRARGEIIGGLTLVWSESGRHYTAQDVVFAEELANRAAVAVDNARLYEEARIAEQQQAELLAQIEALIANAPIGISFMDRNLRYVRINEAMAEINGLPVEAHLEHTMDEVMPNLVPLVGPYVHQVLETGQPILNLEISGVAPYRPGVLRHALVSWYPVLIEGGVPQYIGTTVVDITERKQYETALRESEERFRATFEQAAVGISHVGLDGRWLRVNNRLCEIVGYSREELLGLTFQDVTLPEDLEPDLSMVQKCIAGEIDGYHLEKRYVRKGGAVIWVNLTVSLVREVDTAKPLYFITVVEDITARKATERQLLLLAESSRVLYTSLVDERTLQAAADLLVPRLADWCVINLVRDADGMIDLEGSEFDGSNRGEKRAENGRADAAQQGAIEPVAIAHRDPKLVGVLRRLISEAPIDARGAAGTPSVIRTGRSYFLPTIGAHELAQDPRLAALQQAGLASLMIVPLQARGHAGLNHAGACTGLELLRRRRLALCRGTGAARRAGGGQRHAVCQRPQRRAAAAPA